MNGSYEPPGVFTSVLLATDLFLVCFMMVSWVPQNGFIGHRGGRAMRGSGRGAWQGAPYPGTLRMVAVRRKLPPGANQRARETRNSGDKKNENNPQRFAQVRFRHLGNHDPQQTCQRRRRIPVPAWRQYDTHPLTLRMIEAGQQNPLAQGTSGKL